MARALIFDFDGTIVDTETSLFQAYLEEYEAHGHVLDRDRWISIIGTDDGWDPLVDLERLAAKDAGMFVVATPHGLTSSLDLSRADLVVESLAELSLRDVVERSRS